MTGRLAYSLAEAAAATGLSRSHLDRAIRDGLLKTKTTKLNDAQEPIGKRVILAGDLETYLNELPDA